MAERAEQPQVQPRVRRRRRVSVSALSRDVALLGLIWGASVVLQRAAVAEVEPFSLVGLRLLAALAFFLPFMPRVRGLSADPWRLLDVVVLGAMNPVTTGVLSALALSFASSGLVAVLTSLAPLLTALLARWLVGERPLTRPGRSAGWPSPSAVSWSWWPPAVPAWASSRPATCEDRPSRSLWP